MKQVIVLRGIPASGKSTYAKSFMDSFPAGSVAGINNDDLVAMSFKKDEARQEEIGALLVELRESLLRTFLSSDFINFIIIDNMNLSTKTVNSLQRISNLYGANFTVDDSFLAVPLQVCIERDAMRGSPVGVNVITKMSYQASKLKPWIYELPLNIEPYENDPKLPSVWIFDIDGTLALMGDRSPYEWGKVGLDTVNNSVARVLEKLSHDDDVIFLSGRDGSCYAETQAWIRHRLGDYSPLFMRTAGDMRPDYIVKYELFQEHIAGKYHVVGVFDDRDQVVDLWRNKLGLPTFQVANGAF